VVSITPWPLFTPGKEQVPIVQEAGWAQGPVWTGAENLTPTGIRFPDSPARTQSLYRLRYPATNETTIVFIKRLHFRLSLLIQRGITVGCKLERKFQIYGHH